MSNTQIDLTIPAAIIIVNFVITFLYRKYDRLRKKDKKLFDLGNYSSTTSISPGSFIPGFPFMILRKQREPSARNIVIAHNLLCIIVYVLFAVAIFHLF